MMVSQEAWIFPQISGSNVVGYYAQTGGQRRRFPKLDEALAYARQTIGRQMLEQAQAAGAQEPHLEFEQLSDGVESYRLRARAIGSPRLGV